MPVLQMNIKPYCNCHATGNWQRQDGYSLDPPSGLWVHPRCGKPSKMNYDRMLGKLPQIPQPKREEQYWEVELRIEAEKINTEELGWTPQDNDDEYL